MEIKRIGVLSCAKLLAILYAALGLLGGIVVSGVSLLGFAMGGDDAGASIFFGVLAIVFFPVFYGIAGAIGGLISAVIYNLAARFVGGIVVEVEMNNPSLTG